MAPPESAPQACGVQRNSSIDDTKYYLITIKNNAMKFTSLLELEKVYRALIESITSASVQWSANVGYELDSRSRLHLHTYISTSRQLYFPKYQKHGWTIHFKLIPKNAIPDIIRYIIKGCQHPAYLQQLETESMIYNQPMESLFT